MTAADLNGEEDEGEDHAESGAEAIETKRAKITKRMKVDRKMRAKGRRRWTSEQAEESDRE